MLRPATILLAFLIWLPVLAHGLRGDFASNEVAIKALICLAYAACTVALVGFAIRQVTGPGTDAPTTDHAPDAAPKVDPATTTPATTAATTEPVT